jgi:hypothetical protein
MEHAGIRSKPETAGGGGASKGESQRRHQKDAAPHDRDRDRIVGGHLKRARPAVSAPLQKIGSFARVICRRGRRGTGQVYTHFGPLAAPTH